MSAGTSLLFEKQDRIATIKLNRPDQGNAFNRRLIADLHAAVSRVAVDNDIGIVVLTGSGKNFCAGADIKKARPFNTRIAGEHIDNTYKPVLTAMAEMEKPIICAVNGAAVGIGSAFVMNCDLVIMGERAFFYEAFSNIGLIPDGGASWWLTRSMGYHKAYQLVVEAGRLSSEQCLVLGLANKVVPDKQLMEEAYLWANRLLERAPISLGAAKRVMRQSMVFNYGETISMETVLQMICKRSMDYHEGLTAFNEKRKPVFKGE